MIINRVDTEDQRQAIADARAARETPAPTLAQPEPAPLHQQAQEAALQAADLNAASAQLADNWSAVVKTHGHEIKLSPPPVDQATLSSAQEQYQIYMGGAVRSVLVGNTDNGEIYASEALSGEELAAYQANFRSETGLTAADLSVQQSLQAAAQQRQQEIDAANALQQEKDRRILAAQTFATTSYGLNDHDKQLLANPEAGAAGARYQAAASQFQSGLDQNERALNSESGGTFVALEYSDLNSFRANYVDPATGLAGSELAHLAQAQQEQVQGDAASAKLRNLKVGSFSGNESVGAVPADQAFRVIGKDQMDQLLAQGNSTLGKAYVLDATGQLIIPDEHETGVYFLSNATASQLRAGGVIDEGNGGLNIDGLYLDYGSAYLGTSRPKGGLFGSMLNGLSHILPGGTVGRLLADTISDTTEFINRPAQELTRAFGDEHGLVAQAIDLTNVTVDVSAHARETGSHTFDELARRSVEDADALRLINTVGTAMISSGVLAPVGTVLTVTSGAVLAGQAQLQGQDADPDAGIIQAATAYMLSQMSPAGSQGSFVSGAANNIASQALTTGDVDLGTALQAGALSVIGANTQIGNGISGLQLFQLGRAAAEGDANAAASALIGMVGSNQSYHRDLNPNLNSTADNEGKNPTEGTRATTQQPAAQAEAPTPSRQDVRRIDNAIDNAGRTVLHDGTVIQRTEGSNRITIQTSTQDRLGFNQAFAAARSHGLGVFEWNGTLYNTATGDQVDAAARRIVAGNSDLREEDVSRVGGAVLRSISQDALNVANNPNRANQPGMDEDTLGAELRRIVNEAQSRNVAAMQRLLAEFPAVSVSNTDQTDGAIQPPSALSPEMERTAALAKKGDPTAVIQNTQNILDLTRDLFRQDYIARYRQDNGGDTPSDQQISQAHHEAFLKAFTSARYGFGRLAGIDESQQPRAFNQVVGRLLESFPNGMTAGSGSGEMRNISINHLLSGIQWNSTDSDGISEWLLKNSLGRLVNSHAAEIGKGLGIFPGHSGEEPGHSGIYAADSATLQRMFVADPTAAMRAFLANPQAYIREGMGPLPLTSPTLLYMTGRQIIRSTGGK